MARKEKNIHYIYKTTCNVTGRWYIGMHSTTTLSDGYMGSGKILRYSIRKYGVDNHTKEILEFCETRELLVLRETEMVCKELISDDLCMNICLGGEGGFISLEGAKKGGLTSGKIHKNKLETDIDYLKKHSERASENMKFLNKSGKIKPFNWSGHPHTNESREKMSEAKKGKYDGDKNPSFGTCWITKDGLNKKIKKEVLDEYLLSEWIKGRK